MTGWTLTIKFEVVTALEVRVTWYEFAGEFNWVTPKWLTDVVEKRLGGEWYIDQQWENHGRDGAILRRKEDTMEKRGVQIDDEAAEAAKKTKTCPKCGQVLDETNPPKCGNCGTEPFESREEK